MYTRRSFYRRMFFLLFFVVVLGITKIAFAADGALALEEGLTFRELVKAGGLVMIVIEALSILIIALGIISFIVIRRRRFIPDDVVEDIAKYVGKGDIKKAYGMCEKSEVPFCRILGAGLKRAIELMPKRRSTSQGNLYVIQKVFVMENIKKSMEIVGMREMDRLRNLVLWFSNIGVIAPMLGLLGTVLGMIKAFGAIAFKVETGKPILLSSAISQAMVTTAGGLIVGIIAMMFYYFFSSKINIIVATTEDIAESLIDEVEKNV